MTAWTYSDYQDVSDAVFAKMDKSVGTAAVIAYDQDGANPLYQQYATSDEASAAYDALVNAPGKRWWISLYDTVKSSTADGRVDETYLGGVNQETVKTQTKTTTVKTSSGWGIVAGFFAGLLGLAALTRKKH